jgi:hypothetical protein
LIGLQGVHGGVWKWLHTAAADLVVWLVGLHIALHWKWIVNAVKKYLFGWLPKLPRRRAVTTEQAEMPL